ncbi:MAG: DNA mismatch repair protein MutS [Bacteroidetes bacterium]|nr:DNA mismatch repair protein MutS [Bacteroidota bacterium]PHX83229.1 MAG: DNA mismatch repair protein MutS [Flavobacteriales bacterium]
MAKVKVVVNGVVETPLMKQFNSIKARYPDAMLLFRVGDFYETFGTDAIKASAVLGIVLTKRANGAAAYIELAGFPHHSLDTYLPKLVRAGMRVAICDQMEDPKLTKTIVKRDVTELVTPGVSFSDKVLDHRSNNFLAAVFINGRSCGVSFLDVSTGEFLAAQGDIVYVEKLLQNFRPSEVLFQKSRKKEFLENFGDKFYIFGLDDWIFTEEFSTEKLIKHFNTNSLKGFGVDGLAEGTIAAGAVLHYLSETNHERVQHISALSRIEEDKYVWLDRFTIRNLELFGSANENARTLTDVIDRTVSPMGARLLKRWLALPLKDIAPINERLDGVQALLDRSELRDALIELIKPIGDLERLVAKAAAGRINPRELMVLRRALDAIGPIQTLCLSSGNIQLEKIAAVLDSCSIIRDRIAKDLHPEPPMLVHKGSVIADGVDLDLDELRHLAFSGKDYLLKLQHRESESTKIPSLKVAFNNVFGYYLEVSNAHKDKVPLEWIRKQTLVNAERYITPELKTYEEKILGAEEKILAIEQRLFAELVLSLGEWIVPIQRNAAILGKLDCLIGFAKLAEQQNYVRPHINDSYILDIKNGRHPVIEQMLPAGETYIANDIYLDPDAQQLLMITGPNMAGKSALLRQTALIVLLAQMGSFVPATHAQIGLVDKIFTRVGASDNISSGESTFMVEMNETASILNNLSKRSLVLLDEIGRGTSTYDGISIAWSIAEFIHEQQDARAKTLFATHYHELNDMADRFPRIRNFNVSVKEVGNKVIFLRKLIAGGSEHSFGIHVAKMAGMPRKVLERAKEVLIQLEKSHSGSELMNDAGKRTVIKKEEDLQLSFFQLDDPVLENIREELIKVDINTLTPVEALMKLNEIKKMIGGK